MESKGNTKFVRAKDVYNYTWTFNGHTTRDLQHLMYLRREIMTCTQEIRFKSGILAHMDHYVKFYISNDGWVYGKMYKGEFQPKNDFTNCVCYAPTIRASATTSKCKFESGSTLQQEGKTVSLDTLKAKLGSGSDFAEDKSPGQTFWLLFGQFTDAATVYSPLANIFNSDIKFLTFRISLDHFCWNKDVTFDSGPVDVHNSSSKASGQLDTARLFLSTAYSDFTVQCGDRLFPVHRVVLSDRSPVFATMFDQTMEEAATGILSITDFSQETVEELLRFIYTGKTEIDIGNVPELFVIADKYCVNDLKTFSESMLISNVNTENLGQFYDLGKLLSSQKLMDKCYEVFKKYRKELLKSTEDLNSLSEMTLKYIAETE